ncbi:MAG TPA: efflux RND transporter periplasmic adaptor subunit [Candidatus Paceibacterota bacterium]|nr:efflux RND transporter periplasmic adaptor subunit [Candidatus Paceibacterota bacterium]
MAKKRTLYIIGGVVIAGGLVAYGALRSQAPHYQTISVKRGSITETVSVTGNTTPETSLDLGFQSAGTIAEVDHAVGDRVSAGELIARLDTSDLQAQLAQAQANVDAQQAQLANLQAGAQQADIQASQATLNGGEQTLANLYGNASNVLSAAYASSNDAVRTQLQGFFANAEMSNPQLVFSVTNSATFNAVNAARLAASTELNAWQKELQGLSSASPSSTIDAAFVNASGHLATIKNLLGLVSNALTQQVNLSTSTIASYNTLLTAATTEVNTANTNVTAAAQNIASQKITVRQLQAQLDLKLAGATPQQIAAQQAQVEQAQANAKSVQVKIAQGSLVSPINGVITVQNAKVGQVVTPGTSLVSVISDGNLEVDAEVPETDIGKIAVGNPVTMTFDAFQGETFNGKVFFIDPAQTVNSGVVDYKVKVSFDKADPRLKSGLTADLTIDTKTDNDVLILPQYAILQNDQGNFVETLSNGKTTQVPVTLGVSDSQGNIEVTSGVTEGEQVVNVGLKQ